MSARILALLTTFFVSTTALAWSVPIELCTFPSQPSPAGQDIPCTFTNDDGQSFHGVVTRSDNTTYCTGLVAPTPTDPKKADDIEKLYSSLGEDVADAPVCGLKVDAKGQELMCKAPDEGEGGGGVDAVQLCGPKRAWCIVLVSYRDCAHYFRSEGTGTGVSCDDVQ